MAEFYGKLKHETAGFGYVVLNYSDRADPSYGLCVYSYKGYKRNEDISWALTILKPDSETLMAAAACALGLMPPGVFADFLEERIDDLVTKMECDEGVDSLEQVRGVIVELRRIDPTLRQAEVISG